MGEAPQAPVLNSLCRAVSLSPSVSSFSELELLPALHMAVRVGRLWSVTASCKGLTKKGKHCECHHHYFQPTVRLGPGPWKTLSDRELSLSLPRELSGHFTHSLGLWTSIQDGY